VLDEVLCELYEWSIFHLNTLVDIIISDTTHKDTRTLHAAIYGGIPNTKLIRDSFSNLIVFRVE